MITKNNTVAVLMGGVSREADISRKTGTAILQALLSLGYHAVKVEYNPSCVLKQLKAVGAEVVFYCTSWEIWGRWNNSKYT